MGKFYSRSRRRPSRDPVSPRELRRIALRATRQPSTHIPVLHDALLEFYPKLYPEMIKRAHESADHYHRLSGEPRSMTIQFYPGSLARYQTIGGGRYRYPPHKPFTLHGPYSRYSHEIGVPEPKFPFVKYGLVHGLGRRSMVVYIASAPRVRYE